MKPVIPIRYLLPVGLLMLSASFIIKHIFTLPDFADGFIKGAGIGVIFLSLVYIFKTRQSM